MGTMSMMFGRVLGRIGLALVLVGSLAASAHAESVLRRGNGAEPTTLDPHKTDERVVSNILRDLFEGLVTTGPDGRIIPGAAESWTISDDGKIYTFKLRADGRWSNGEPLTSEDFVYSLRRSLGSEAGGDVAANIAIIKNGIEVISKQLPPTDLGIEAPDAATVRMTLNNPAPYFLALLASDNKALPVHRATVEKFGADWIKPGHLVSNGAFSLAEWKPGEQLVLARNPNFHDAATVKLDKVIFYPIADSSEELKRFKAGQLDTTFEVPQEQVKWISLTQPKEFWNRPYLATYYYALNLTAEPFRGNPKLRQALTLAVNREALVNKVTRAGETPAYGLVPPWVAGYRPQQLWFAKLTMSKRLELARRAFADAGYGPSEPLTLEILYNTSENNRMIANAVIAMWQEAFGAGIRVTAVNTDRADYLKRRSSRTFQVVRAAWIGDYVDPTVFLNLLQSKAEPPRNDSGYRNAKYDELLAKAAATISAAERNGLLEQAEKQLLEDLPIIPLYHFATKSLVSPKLQGWVFNIRDVHPSRFLALAN